MDLTRISNCIVNGTQDEVDQAVTVAYELLVQNETQSAAVTILNTLLLAIGEVTETLGTNVHCSEGSGSHYVFVEEIVRSYSSARIFVQKQLFSFRNPIPFIQMLSRYHEALSSSSSSLHFIEKLIAFIDIYRDDPVRQRQQHQQYSNVLLEAVKALLTIPLPEDKDSYLEGILLELLLELQLEDVVLVFLVLNHWNSSSRQQQQRYRANIKREMCTKWRMQIASTYMPQRILQCVDYLVAASTDFPEVLLVMTEDIQHVHSIDDEHIYFLDAVLLVLMFQSSWSSNEKLYYSLLRQQQHEIISLFHTRTVLVSHLMQLLHMLSIETSISRESGAILAASIWRIVSQCITDYSSNRRVQMSNESTISDFKVLIDLVQGLISSSCIENDTITKQLWNYICAIPTSSPSSSSELDDKVTKLPPLGEACSHLMAGDSYFNNKSITLLSNNVQIHHNHVSSIAAEIFIALIRQQQDSLSSVRYNFVDSLNQQFVETISHQPSSLPHVKILTRLCPYFLLLEDVHMNSVINCIEHQCLNSSSSQLNEIFSQQEAIQRAVTRSIDAAKFIEQIVLRKHSTLTHGLSEEYGIHMKCFVLLCRLIAQSVKEIDITLQQDNYHAEYLEVKMKRSVRLIQLLDRIIAQRMNHFFHRSHAIDMLMFCMTIITQNINNWKELQQLQALLYNSLKSYLEISLQQLPVTSSNEINTKDSPSFQEKIIEDITLKSFLCSFNSIKSNNNDNYDDGNENDDEKESLEWDIAAISKQLSSITGIIIKQHQQIFKIILYDTIIMIFQMIFTSWYGLNFIEKNKNFKKEIEILLIEKLYSKSNLKLSLQIRNNIDAVTSASEVTIDVMILAKVWSGSSIHLITGEGPNKIILSKQQTIHLAWERCFFFTLLINNNIDVDNNKNLEVIVLLCQYHSVMLMLRICKYQSYVEALLLQKKQSHVKKEDGFIDQMNTIQQILERSIKILISNEDLMKFLTCLFSPQQTAEHETGEETDCSLLFTDGGCAATLLFFERCEAQLYSSSRNYNSDIILDSCSDMNGQSFMESIEADMQVKNLKIRFLRTIPQLMQLQVMFHRNNGKLSSSNSSNDLPVIGCFSFDRHYFGQKLSSSGCKALLLHMLHELRPFCKSLRIATLQKRLNTEDELIDSTNEMSASSDLNSINGLARYYNLMEGSIIECDDASIAVSGASFLREILPHHSRNRLAILNWLLLHSVFSDTTGLHPLAFIGTNGPDEQRHHHTAFVGISSHHLGRYEGLNSDRGIMVDFPELENLLEDIDAVAKQYKTISLHHQFQRLFGISGLLRSLHRGITSRLRRSIRSALEENEDEAEIVLIPESYKASNEERIHTFRLHAAYRRFFMMWWHNESQRHRIYGVLLLFCKIFSFVESEKFISNKDKCEKLDVAAVEVAVNEEDSEDFDSSNNLIQNENSDDDNNEINSDHESYSDSDSEKSSSSSNSKDMLRKRKQINKKNADTSMTHKNAELLNSSLLKQKKFHDKAVESLLSHHSRGGRCKGDDNRDMNLSYSCSKIFPLLDRNTFTLHFQQATILLFALVISCEPNKEDSNGHTFNSMIAAQKLIIGFTQQMQRMLNDDSQGWVILNNFTLILRVLRGLVEVMELILMKAITWRATYSDNTCDKNEMKLEDNEMLSEVIELAQWLMTTITIISRFLTLLKEIITRVGKQSRKIVGQGTLQMLVTMENCSEMSINRIQRLAVTHSLGDIQPMMEVIDENMKILETESSSQIFDTNLQKDAEQWHVMYLSLQRIPVTAETFMNDSSDSTANHMEGPTSWKEAMQHNHFDKDEEVIPEGFIAITPSSMHRKQTITSQASENKINSTDKIIDQNHNSTASDNSSEDVGWGLYQYGISDDDSDH